MDFEKIYSEYKLDIFNYLCGLTNSYELAEELLAETFFRAFVGFSAFRGESSVKTWLFSIARHCFWQHLQKDKKFVSIEDAVLHQICAQSNIEDDTLLARRVNELMEQKDERSRDVFNLRLQGYSFKEIGDKVGITENSARVLEHRVRMFLQKELRKDGYDNGRKS